jgi:hypothetical protein
MTGGSALAVQTPRSRNRYADFLRAVSIMAVAIGHWLVTAPWVAGGEFHVDTMLNHGEWTHWLSWAFQVMPVFFLVGGYANGISWRSALRSGKPYHDWLLSRLHRLLSPLLPLLATWAALAAVAAWLGLPFQSVQAISRMALIPLWFLAVYLVVILLVPVTLGAWRRYGPWSFWALVSAAALNDVLVLGLGIGAAGWLNYAFVWLAVFQLGYAWLDGHLRHPSRNLFWAAVAAIALIMLVTQGPYPVSMVGVPGQEVTNTQPPKITVLALAVVQCGLLLSIESPMRRWLERQRPWRATMLVNSRIMTTFLWHVTAAILVIALAFLLGGIGLSAVPGSAGWWLMRPAWLGVFAIALAALVVIFGRFERGREAGRPIPAWRPVAGTVMACIGLSMLADSGISPQGWPRQTLIPLLLPFAGAALAGINPFQRLRVPGRPSEE